MLPDPGVKPDTIVVPPPTLPSVPTPIVTLPGGPGTAPTPLFTLRPSIELSEEWSDNFNLNSSGRKDNFRSVAAPGFTLDVNGPFVRGTLGYTLSATYDTSPDEFNLFHSFLGVLAWTPTPRLTFTLSDSFTQSDEPSRTDRLGLRRERREFTSNSLSLRARYLLERIATTGYYHWTLFSSDATDDSSSEKTKAHTLGLSADIPIYVTNTATLGYEYLTSKTDGDSGTGFGRGTTGDSDIRGHSVRASFQRQLTTLVAGGVTGSYSTRQVDRDDSTTTSDDYDTWGMSLFGNYNTNRLALAGSVGYSRVLRKSGNDSGTFNGTASATYRFARAVATLSLESGFSETFAQGQDFGLVQTRGVTGTFSYPFTSAITGTVSAYYRENDGTGVGNSNSDSTNNWGTSLTLDVRLTRWLGLFLDYTHTDASGGGGFDGYVENRARLALRASF